MKVISRLMMIVTMLVSQAYAVDTKASSFMPYPKEIAGNTQPQKSAPVKIVAYGDSLFAGYGLQLDQAFPAGLEKALTEKGYAVKVVPHAVSGGTTAEGLARVNTVLSENPHIVILELGANDLLRALPPEKMRENLDTIIRKLLEARIWVILGGLKAPLNYGIEYAERYSNVYRDLATHYQIPLVADILSGVTGKPQMLLPDGLHPNALGVDVVVHNVLPTVLQILNTR